MPNWNAHHFVKKCGGLLDFSQITDGEKVLLETLNSVVETNIQALKLKLPDLELEQVEFIITNGENRAAFAFQDDANQAVLIDMGLLRWFWERAVAVIHIPSVLPDFLAFSSKDSLEWLNPSVELVPAPVDWDMPDERKDYCVEVFQHMLEHLVLHELAHHQRGHLDLVGGGEQFFALSETSIRALDWPSDDRQFEFHLQDLELDADASALDLSIAALDGKFPRDRFDWEFDTISETLFLILFSQMLVTQLFDDRNLQETDYPSNGHPAPVFRSINFSNLACRAFHSLAGGDWSAYKELHDAAWTEAGHVAEYFKLPFGRWHGECSRVLVTVHYTEIEQRYFEVAKWIDQNIEADEVY